MANRWYKCVDSGDGKAYSSNTANHYSDAGCTVQAAISDGDDVVLVADTAAEFWTDAAHEWHSLLSPMGVFFNDTASGLTVTGGVLRIFRGQFHGDAVDAASAEIGNTAERNMSDSTQMCLVPGALPATVLLHAGSASIQGTVGSGEVGEVIYDGPGLVEGANTMSGSSQPTMRFRNGATTNMGGGTIPVPVVGNEVIIEATAGWITVNAGFVDVYAYCRIQVYGSGGATQYYQMTADAFIDLSDGSDAATVRLDALNIPAPADVRAGVSVSTASENAAVGTLDVTADNPPTNTRVGL